MKSRCTSTVPRTNDGYLIAKGDQGSTCFLQRATRSLALSISVVHKGEQLSVSFDPQFEMNSTAETTKLLRPSLSLKSLDIALLFVASYLLFRLVLIKRQSTCLPLPPGPRAIPFIDNLLDLPKGPEGPHWGKHKALYGKPCL